VSAREEPVEIPVGARSVSGTVLTPGERLPGMLFVHGWAGNQQQYLARAREIAALGCICLTFDLQGHASTSDKQHSVTREDNLRDVLAAYDLLATMPTIDKQKIGVVGSSYGGYLAAILTSLRPVRWLALRVPALYLDEDWTKPKQKLDKRKIASYRRGPVSANENRALGACASFRGDVLIVECENDDVVPGPTIANYREAFERPQSITYRVIAGADHALSKQAWQESYTSILLSWATEMVVGVREGGETPQAHTTIRSMPRRGPARPA
jgi:dienelactone hydrolase